MTYDDAMTQMKLGRAARREGWQGIVRIDGLQAIRVKPGVTPFRFYASREDQAATDWVASSPPVSVNIVNYGPKGGVDGSADRS